MSDTPPETPKGQSLARRSDGTITPTPERVSIERSASKGIAKTAAQAERLPVEYLRAVKDDWVARMSGPASIILAFLAAYFEFIVKHGLAVLWVAAAACLLLTSYRIWSKERRELIAERVKNALPNITGRIKEVYFDRNWSTISFAISEHNYDEYVFYVNTYIANHGAETSIEEYKFVLNVDGKPYLGERMTVENYYILRPGAAYKSLTDIENSNDEPLKHTRNGWLRFGFLSNPIQRVNDESDEELEKRNIEIELDVIDKHGTPHRLEGLPPPKWVKNELWGVNRVSSFRDM